MKENKIRTVYVTKYALTTGIFKLECKIHDNGYAEQMPLNEIGYFLKPNEYALTKKRAVVMAELLRTRKIESLIKTHRKLNALDFTI